MSTLERPTPESSSARRLSTPRQRALLIVGSMVVGLLACEIVARITFERHEGPFTHNPVIQRQAEQVGLFEVDRELGHRLLGGSFVGVYESGLVSMDRIVADRRRIGRTIVLNLGDSSTSGWDSNVIAANTERHRRGEPLKSPLQVYKTYSDVMAEDSRWYVINAGVPGYSSVQGAAYLRRLFRAFTRAAIKIDVVTIYFGNNDSAWNGNIADKYRIPTSEPVLHLRRLLDAATQRFRIVPRVDPAEYADEFRAMIADVRAAGATPVVIEPVIPHVWPPGLRAAGLEADVDKFLMQVGSDEVGRLLASARAEYAKALHALEERHDREAKMRFETAREQDYLVPRIKLSHLDALRQVTTRMDLSLVAVANDIPLDDRSYFVDYCHPIEPANRIIARTVFATIAPRAAFR